jgi:hypothetical protein
VVSPESITEENLALHVGNDKSVPFFRYFAPRHEVDVDVDVDFRFYQAYRDFFKSEVDRYGVVATIEKWVFGASGNTASRVQVSSTGTKDNEKQNPQMLGRLMSLLLHPFIHIGYGLEFGLPVMVIEGAFY